MKKNGFTLIELLAVIVILVIIFAITIPLILNVVETAKKGAAIDSAYGYIDAVEKNNQLFEIDSTKYAQISDDTDIDISDIKVSLKGEHPVDGIVTIQKGKVVSTELCIHDYYVIYENNEARVTSKCSKQPKTYTITYNLDGGEATNPETYTKKHDAFTLNNPTKVGYVFKGWTGTDLSGVTETVTIGEKMKGDREYTAVWEQHYDVTTYTATFKDVHDKTYAIEKVYELKSLADNSIKYLDKNQNEITGKTITLPAIPANDYRKDGDIYTILVSDIEHLPTGFSSITWTNDNSTYYSAGSTFTFGSNLNETFKVSGQLINKLTNNWEIDATHITSFVCNEVAYPGMYGDSYALITWYGVDKDGNETLIGAHGLAGQNGVNASWWSSNMGSSIGWTNTAYLITDLTPFVKIKGVSNNAYVHSSVSASSVNVRYTFTFDD